MAKTCSIEGCNYPVWSKNLCKSHAPKKPLKKSFKPINKITEKQKEKNVIKKEKTKVLHQFFLDLWDERADKNGCIRCFETDIYMSPTIYRENSCCYHHILEKSNPNYKQYALEKWNIVIILPDVHNQVHANIEFTPKIKKLTEKLKSKYGIN